MELEGRTAPPMANGELVFDAPWQGRVFGMAHTLCEQGLYEWDEFRAHLIATIDAWDRQHPSDEEYRYYDLFLHAFTELLDKKGVCLEDDIDERFRELAARPHGHDH
ncbi:MAG TPA: nitrile hydratase accessory protein [Pseudomonadales bacterium]|nr:nitrile hydratase accessory protein [Pseudomonadales bacterium]